VGEYVADLVVEEYLIVELKCVDRLANEHQSRRQILSSYFLDTTLAPGGNQ
jgi:hypothetical protein